MTGPTDKTDQTTDSTIDNAVVTDQNLDQPNPLEMSDEDFLKQPAPGAQVVEKSVDKPTEGGGDDAGGEGTGDKSQKTGSEPGEGSGASQDPHAGEGNTDKTALKEGKPGEKTGEPATDKDKPGEKTGQAEKTDKSDKPAANTDVVADVATKAAAYDRLMAPFKANGREIQARSVEDAISLMQMGANYNKRMAGLKPSFKILKLLENNDLLSEEKLGFLIDLSKKDPNAINKLVKDSGLNPMDLDPDKAGEYRPSAQKVDDREVELDTVLDDLKDATGYQKTLAVAKGWDEASKKVIGDQPVLLKVINDHIESGVYELINTEVQRERTFGRLQGLSDIAAYRQVGDAIQARGGFNHLFNPSATAQVDQKKSSEAGKVVEPNPKKDNDDESRNDKRRALGSPRAAAPSGSIAKDYNPLALSDEEFLKQAAPKFR